MIGGAGVGKRGGGEINWLQKGGGMTMDQAVVQRCCSMGCSRSEIQSL